MFPIYLLAEVGDGDGNKGVALILRTGYAFTEIETWLEGVFATREEAMDWMLSQGRCVRAG
ncbi:MAG: hypothetical protein IPJ30_12055 [Acidobacteria bacterium]|nr:hypothetical protein [Acidobacteriota bacterium]